MIYAYSEVEQILEKLEELVERESKLDCMDMTINDCHLDDIKHLIIPVLESIVAEPNDSIYDEPPITMNEMHNAAYQQHLEMHS
tara:strand:- start:87 stop:338 length:252 start_codon:yes stop_codon:yes gene_type:complete